MQKPNKKQILYFGCTLICGFVALGGYWGWMHYTATPEPPADFAALTQKSKAASPPLPVAETLSQAKKPQNGAKTEEQQPTIKGATLTPPDSPSKPVVELAQSTDGETHKTTSNQAAPTVVSPQNVGRLTALQGELEELKILVAIDELAKKLRSAPPEAAVPTLPLPMALETPAKVERPRSASSPVVVGVQGIDGKLSASVRTASGQLTILHIGDRFAGGIVSNISRHGVMITTNGKHNTLTFE